MGRTSTSALLVGLLFASAASATQTGQIHGVVTDPDGKPLENVVVTLVGPTTSGRPTTTDEHGEFRFFQLAPGSYSVWADEHGPRVAWRGIGVRVGVTSRVSLTVRTGKDDNECSAEPDGDAANLDKPQEEPVKAPQNAPPSSHTL